MQLQRVIFYAFFVLALLNSCGGSDGPDANRTYSIGGTVSGLKADSRLTLLSAISGQNSWVPTTVSQNGGFTLNAPVPHNGSYAVTVGDQPPFQTCTVGNGSGAGIVANVSVISVVCSDFPFKVNTLVSGLSAGNSVTLSNNGVDPIKVDSNGSFDFPSPIARGGSYSITVLTQPVNQICSVNGGSGANVSSDIRGISVVCSDRSLKISGSVVGLKSGTQVTLFNNGADPIIVASNGTFEFKAPVALRGSYDVTLGPQSIGQSCSIQNGKGSGLTADVASVTVICSSIEYYVSGNVFGLALGKEMTVSNNTSDSLKISSNGPFRFNGAVPIYGSYSIAVTEQPVGQTCTANNRFGYGIRDNVSNIDVVCSDISFKVSGLVSGLSTGQQLTIAKNAETPLQIDKNGPFTFIGPVAFDGSYSVSIVSQPSAQTCSIENASGEGVVANISSVRVSCNDKAFELQVALTGLDEGERVTLLNNASEPLTLTKDGSYKFLNKGALGGVYKVTVATQPTSQICTVENSSASFSDTKPAIVNVLCSKKTLNISGSVVGLNTGEQVTLLNNGSNATKVTQNQKFTFTTPIAFNGGYSVTVGTQPINQRCTVIDGKGDKITENVTIVEVRCIDVFAVGGIVEGLGTTEQVTLVNRGVDEITLGTNGAFKFPTLAAKGESYLISVKTQPKSQTCFVLNSAGTNVSQATTNVTTKCVNGTGLTGLGGAGG